jgi:hypothetical protein
VNFWDTALFHGIKNSNEVKRDQTRSKQGNERNAYEIGPVSLKGINHSRNWGEMRGSFTTGLGEN